MENYVKGFFYYYLLLGISMYDHHYVQTYQKIFFTSRNIRIL